MEQLQIEIPEFASIQELENVFKTTREAIFVHDYEYGKLLHVNEAMLVMYGLTRQEVLSIDMDNVTGGKVPHTVEEVHELFKKVKELGEIAFEWHDRRKNGQFFWTDNIIKIAKIDGQLRILVLSRDITERKKKQLQLQSRLREHTHEIVALNEKLTLANEELKIINEELETYKGQLEDRISAATNELKKSEDRFRSIIQYLTDIILILDSDLNILYESPSTRNVLGYEAGYLIGKPCLPLVHPEELDQVIHALDRVFSHTSDENPIEFRVKHKEGHWISLEAIGNNLLDHPAIQGIVITCRDITERKKVEKALTLSESKFRNIFNNSSDAIIMVDSSYNILEVNEVFLRITGYTMDDTRKMKFSEIITDTYLPEMVDQLVRFIQLENPPAIESEILCKSKCSIPVEINSKIIEFEGEIALVSIIRVITERRQLESRILDTIIATEEKEREKFARNLHDELGPLLSSIRMYINSLSADMEKEKHEFIISQLKKILNEAIQCTKEVSNDLSPHVLADYGLLAALEWFDNQIKPYISITLETNLKDERYASSLELAIYRIIKELINNTLKHARAKSITIKLHRILHSIHMVYSDNGKGFPGKWQDNFESMGMGMSNIMSRCRSIKANSKFYNHAPNGMSFELEVPI